MASESETPTKAAIAKGLEKGNAPLDVASTCAS